MKCPNCGGEMSEGYFIIGGGVWWCESHEYLEYHVSDDPPLDEMQRLNRKFPLHTIVSSRGYRNNEKWPKSGQFCKNSKCLTMVIRPTPR